MSHNPVDWCVSLVLQSVTTKAYNHCICFCSENVTFNGKNLFFIKVPLQHHLPYKGICKVFFFNIACSAARKLLPIKTRVLLCGSNLIRWVCLYRKADQKSYFPKYIFSKKAIFQSNSLLFECSVRGNTFQSILLHKFLCEERDIKFVLCLSLLRAA